MFTSWTKKELSKDSCDILQKDEILYRTFWRVCTFCLSRVCFSPISTKKGAKSPEKAEFNDNILYLIQIILDF